MTPLLGAVLLYLALQFAIGIWASRRVRTEADYLVAGRNLGYPLAIATTFATWFGAETIVGSAGTAYREGVSLWSAEPFGYGLCLLLMGLLFAAPLWRRELTTLADLFRLRYSPGVERLAALILIPGSVLWAAAQIRAFGHVLATTSTLETDVAIGVAAGVVILYSIFGGMLADAVTDMVQGVMLVVGLVIVAGAVVLHLGGVADSAAAAADAVQVRWAERGEASAWRALEAWAIPVCGSVFAAELVQRVIAARSPAVARRSSVAAGALYLGVGIVPVFLGLAGAGMALDMADPEQVIPTLARQLLPTALYALFAGALISAILSTVDSTLLVSAGLLSHNVVVPLLGAPGERVRVRVARAGVMAFGVIAFVLARRAEGVFALVEQASSFGSAGALVTILFALFTRWGGPPTAYATLGLGVASYLLAAAAGAPYPFLTSLAAALAAYVVGGSLESLRRRGAAA